MKTWNDKLTVELTVEQWQQVESAMRDARRSNVERGWDASASVIERVLEKLGEQVNEAFDEACKMDDIEMTARFANVED